MIDDEVIRYRDERKKKKEDEQEVQEAIQRARTKRPADDTGFDDESNPENSGDETEMNTSTRGRGRGRGRGSRGAQGGSGDASSKRGSRGGRGGRGSKKAPIVAESQNSILNAFASQNSRSSRSSKKTDTRLDSFGMFYLCADDFWSVELH